MKMSLNENGSILIDGENNTVVYGHLCIEPGLDVSVHNFIVSGLGGIPLELTRRSYKNFGSDIKIKDKKYRYIGIQDETEVYWDENENRIVLGKTPQEIKELLELHKDVDPFGEEDW